MTVPTLEQRAAEIAKRLKQLHPEAANYSEKITIGVEIGGGKKMLIALLWTTIHEVDEQELAAFIALLVKQRLITARPNNAA